jgi:hypothetical protein
MHRAILFRNHPENKKCLLKTRICESPGVARHPRTPPVWQYLFPIKLGVMPVFQMQKLPRG